MQLVRLLFAAVVAVLMGVGYVQERNRLARVRTLPAAQARDEYERSRQRDDRVLYGMAALFVALGVLAALDLWGFLPRR